jgi:hypothetical protein
VNINSTWSKIGVLAWIVGGVASGTMAEDFKAVPELGYRVNPYFFHGAERLSLGEASGMALTQRDMCFVPARAPDADRVRRSRQLRAQYW